MSAIYETDEKGETNCFAVTLPLIGAEFSYVYYEEKIMNLVEDESQLVAAACKGSLPAFEALVGLYEPRIRRMLYGMTHDIQLTQDLCQETFLAVYRTLPRMDGATLHFSAWIYRIALNQVRSEWRRRKNVSLMPFTSFADAENEGSDDGAEDLASPERLEERVVERDLVQHVLAQLPPVSVLCLLLDAEGFTYREIAEISQESLSAVRSRLSRARLAFQRIYHRLNSGKVL
jgi:RNA polymerase sigma-70 factor (ECF subfamily)